jgi:hypothetical protein
MQSLIQKIRYKVAINKIYHRCSSIILLLETFNTTDVLRFDIKRTKLFLIFVF